MSDINKVWLSGLVVTRPLFTKLPSTTPVTSFLLQINEKFRDREKNVQFKQNLIPIESLGKNAESTADRVKEGSRFIVDGYLRQDLVGDRNTIRVRSFAIYPDESSEDAHYKNGLSQALKILAVSPDLKSAAAKIQELMGAE